MQLVEISSCDLHHNNGAIKVSMWVNWPANICAGQSTYGYHMCNIITIIISPVHITRYTTPLSRHTSA